MDQMILLNVYEQKYHYKYLALYHALRDAILIGKLQYGMKLPATRKLAEQYELSRGTVSQVYEMLYSEGYITTKRGSGSYVSYQNIEKQISEYEEQAIQLSDWGNRIKQITLRREGIKKKETISFHLGTPDLNHFPFQEWNRMMYAKIREMKERMQENPANVQGSTSLRKAIVRYLK